MLPSPPITRSSRTKHWNPSSSDTDLLNANHHHHHATYQPETAHLSPAALSLATARQLAFDTFAVDLHQPHRPAPLPPTLPLTPLSPTMPVPVTPPPPLPSESMERSGSTSSRGSSTRTSGGSQIILSPSLPPPPPPPPRHVRDWPSRRRSSDMRMDVVPEAREYEDILDIVDAYGGSADSSFCSDVDIDALDISSRPPSPPPATSVLLAEVKRRPDSYMSKASSADDSGTFMHPSSEAQSREMEATLSSVARTSWPMPGAPLVSEHAERLATVNHMIDERLLQSLTDELHDMNVRTSIIYTGHHDDGAFADASVISGAACDRPRSLEEMASLTVSSLEFSSSLARLRQADSDFAACMPDVSENSEEDIYDGPLDEEEEEEEDEDLTDRRRAAIKEMLTTERAYVRALKRLCECFLYPLRSMSKQRTSLITNVRQGLRSVRGTLKRERRTSLNDNAGPGGRTIDAVQPRTNVPITEVDVKLIFGNIEMILSVHKRILRILEDLHHDWNAEKSVSSIYRQLLPAMPLYQVYVENFTHACATLERLTSQSKEFRKFIKQRDEEDMDAMNLKAYLNLPLRRIGRYRTYLTHQAALMSNVHDDYENVTKLLDSISQSSDKIALSVSETENRLRLQDMEKAISGLPGPISTRQRRLVHLGRLNHFTAGEGESTVEERFVLLLDDRIIWARETEADQFTFKGQLMLADAFFTDLADTPLYEHAFRVVSGSGNEVVFCAPVGENEKREWLQQLQHVLDRLDAVNNGYVSRHR
ncbi:hypothetical protein THASP1DRAFT_32541 [Thamnocephalis sphaerospora]|uniref:DH domain-containing protein n=1 Tax=Thamnocephalis sphaerospora TaxID=78915 RepID=A0A4P9XJR9_9FUNG|nr:hypothetical protein THASP1DRAFT_32541 [Thamnocephalis sphaerospora]|eukprot:RKP05621.1 hypothetical protein THASP1DRAFT_32541 [Thamnocephalis sphaerospora]